MSSKEDKPSCSDEKDEELEQLLDSALQDFENPLPEKVDTDVKSSAEEKTPESSSEQLWNDEFFQEYKKQFEENLKAIVDGESDITLEQIMEQFQQPSEGTSKVMTENSVGDNFSATIAETLRNLSENSENLQAEIGDDLATMLGGLNLDSAEGEPDIFPFMQNMMQSFLSKEVLYPCIKEVVNKYPGWFEEHKDDISPSELESFKKQHELLEEVCTEFEKETPNDSNETKKMRFSKILSLMENMQKFGHPPKEIVGSSPFTFDENGAPNPLPGMDPSQCRIM